MKIFVTFSVKRPRKTWFYVGEVGIASSFDVDGSNVADASPPSMKPAGAFAHTRLCVRSASLQEEVPWEQWVVNAEVRQITNERGASHLPLLLPSP